MEQTKMKAVVLEAFGQPLVVKEIDIPVPSAGEVLIKVEASPINPSDAMFLKGAYPNPRTVPCVPGFEGSGVVVKSGGGAQADALLNKRVAFTSGGQHGSYAQYTTAHSGYVFPIPDELSLVAAASSFINPVTVIGMLDLTQRSGVKAVVHSAAASQLGRQMERYFTKHGIKVINIVRRQEQVEILQKEGATIIINSSEEGYLPKLKELAAQHGATIFFDPIGGAQTGEVLSQMPDNSIAYVYGALSLQPSSLAIPELIFKGKEIRGFWLVKWLQSSTPETVKTAFETLVTLLSTDLKTEVGKEVPLDEGQEAFRHYLKNMSAGKVLFRPNLEN